MRRLFFFFTLLTALNWGNVLAAEPDLQSIEGRLDFISVLIENHPESVRSNLQFNRSVFDTATPIPGVTAQLGKESNPLWQEEQTRWISQYLGSEDARFDLSALEALRERLLADLGKLSEILSPTSLKADSEKLKGLSYREGKLDQSLYKSQLQRLLRLAPFLYDHTGKVADPLPLSGHWEKVRATLLSLDRGTLEDSYHSLYRQHLKPLVASLAQNPGQSVLSQASAHVENQFIKRDLTKALTPTNPKGEAVSRRRISIETTPPSMAVYRGCHGGDCSIVAVPYFPLSKGTKTYIIRKGSDHSAKPDGYALVTPAEVNGKKLPYIVTVNGARLGEEDVRQVTLLIAKDWNSTRLLRPDFLKNHSTVNTGEIKKGFEAIHSAPAQAKLSKSWRKLAQSSDGTNGYYDPESLKFARVFDTKDIPDRNSTIERSSFRLPYEPNLDKVPLMDRGILAHQVLESSVTGKELDQAKVLQHLHLNQEQFLIARTLTPGKIQEIDYQKFKEAQNQLGFKLEDFLLWSPSDRKALKTLYESSPNLATPARWRALFDKTQGEFNREWATLAESEIKTSQLKELVKARIDVIPTDFNPIPEDFLTSVLAELDRVSDFTDPIASSGLKETLKDLYRDPPQHRRKMSSWILERLGPDSKVPRLALYSLLPQILEDFPDLNPALRTVVLRNAAHGTPLPLHADLAHGLISEFPNDKELRAVFVKDLSNAFLLDSRAAPALAEHLLAYSDTRDEASRQLSRSVKSAGIPRLLELATLAKKQNLPELLSEANKGLQKLLKDSTSALISLSDLRSAFASGFVSNKYLRVLISCAAEVQPQNCKEFTSRSQIEIELEKVWNHLKASQEFVHTAELLSDFDPQIRNWIGTRIAKEIETDPGLRVRFFRHFDPASGNPSRWNQALHLMGATRELKAGTAYRDWCEKILNSTSSGTPAESRLIAEAKTFAALKLLNEGRSTDSALKVLKISMAEQLEMGANPTILGSQIIELAENPSLTKELRAQLSAIPVVNDKLFSTMLQRGDRYGVLKSGNLGKIADTELRDYLRRNADKLAEKVGTMESSLILRLAAIQEPSAALVSALRERMNLFAKDLEKERAIAAAMVLDHFKQHQAEAQKIVALGKASTSFYTKEMIDQSERLLDEIGLVNCQVGYSVLAR